MAINNIIGGVRPASNDNHHIVHSGCTDCSVERHLNLLRMVGDLRRHNKKRIVERILIRTDRRTCNNSVNWKVHTALVGDTNSTVHTDIGQDNEKISRKEIIAESRDP